MRLASLALLRSGPRLIIVNPSRSLLLTEVVSRRNRLAISRLRSLGPSSQLLLQQCRAYSRRTPTYNNNNRRSLSFQRADLNPVVFLLAATVSLGIAIFAASYRSSLNTSSSSVVETREARKSRANIHPAITMAPSMPPGRPGNLTAEQETKLKEMWAATLEVFGVAHEPAAQQQANGNATPGVTSPEKKKKKNRLSIFSRKNKDSGGGDTDGAGDTAGAGGNIEDNDKHGQTKEFQQALASQSSEELRDAFWSMTKHDHPDALLLRFLRARKWDVHAALIMLVSTMHWRSREIDVDDDIMFNGEGQALKESQSSNSAEKKEGEDFMTQLRLGKSFLHGTDAEGRPCCWVRVRLHRQGEQSEKSLERFTVYTIETTRLLLRPPVDTAVSSFSEMLFYHGKNGECFWADLTVGFLGE